MTRDLLDRFARIVALALACACAAPTGEAQRISQQLGAPAISMLFVGNSLTGTQTAATSEDLPMVLSRLASSRGRTLEIEKVINPSHTLLETWNAQLPQPFLTGARQWDFIMLQELSTLPVQNPDEFFSTVTSTYQPSVRRSLKPESGTLLLFENWALVDPYPFANRREYVAALDANYARLSGLLTTPNAIAPFSKGFEKVLATKPQSYLFQPDGKHPSDAAIYLNACVSYAVVFRESPVGLPALHLSSEDAAFLQSVAAGFAGVASAADAGTPADAGTDAGVTGPEVPAQRQSDPVSLSSTGCSSVGALPGWIVALGGLALALRRRAV